MSAPPPSMAEHWDLLWQVLLAMFVVLGVAGTAVWFFGKFILNRVWFNIDLTHKKLDALSNEIQNYLKLHYECQTNLATMYVDRQRFNEFYQEWKNYTEKRDRQWEEMWRVFNGHFHESPSGLVVRHDK